MVLTTVAGDSGYAIAISTATTGAAGSETPDGSVVYFFCEKITIQRKSQDKRKPIAGENTTKTIAGKVDLMVICTNCTITKEVTATPTAEMDAIDTFCHDHGTKIGSTKVYLFVKNLADSAYKKLSWNSGGTFVRYVYGYVSPPTAELGKGGMYVIPSLVFEQVTL